MLWFFRPLLMMSGTLLTKLLEPIIYLLRITSLCYFFSRLCYLFHELCFFRGILELNYSHSCLWVQAINHTMTLKTTRSPACLMKQYKFYSQSDLGTFNFLHCLSRIFSFGIKNVIKYYRSSPRPGLTALFAYRLCSTII